MHRYIGKTVKSVCSATVRFNSNIAQNNLKYSSCLHSLKTRIRFSGPITVYDYMKEVLTNPRSGYYITKDVFGLSGDFTTSPEISQLFGEMIALWFLNEWTKLGSPKPLQLVELGPGRGSMMADILRILKQVKVDNEISVHLVEVSDELSQIQGKKICRFFNKSTKEGCYLEGKTENDVPVYWHKNIHDVPKCFSCILAHEFFDALPVHILKKMKEGWREVLIDLADGEDKLRFVLSTAPTPACVYSKYSKGRDYFEISPQSGLIMEHIAARLEEFGGFSLVIDYGHAGDKKDTFRGFRKHQVVNPLEAPGTSDLTADVDFSFLKEAVGDKLLCYGPVSQHFFFKQLHIDVRLQMLLKRCKTEKEKNDLKSGYHMIIDSDKMGECFKVISFFPLVLKEYLNDFPVAGFVN